MNFSKQVAILSEVAINARIAEMEKAPELHFVVFHEDDQWIAQCLEHDIRVKSRWLDQLKRGLVAALSHDGAADRDSNRRDIEKLPVASPQFFQMWENRSIFNETGHAGHVNYQMALCI